MMTDQDLDLYVDNMRDLAEHFTQGAQAAIGMACAAALIVELFRRQRDESKDKQPA